MIFLAVIIKNEKRLKKRKWHQWFYADDWANWDFGYKKKALVEAQSQAEAKMKVENYCVENAIKYDKIVIGITIK